VQGKGVSFMENRLEWHYRNLTPELAAQALAEIGPA
jgi:transketolase